jgi:hypothetical protein
MAIIVSAHKDAPKVGDEVKIANQVEATEDWQSKRQVIWRHYPPDIKFRMKKRIITDTLPSNEELNSHWLDMEVLAEVEVTSEDKGYPIEGALLPNQSRGWKAGIPGKQTIRLLIFWRQTWNERKSMSFVVLMTMA